MFPIFKRKKGVNCVANYRVKPKYALAIRKAFIKQYIKRWGKEYYCVVNEGKEPRLITDSLLSRTRDKKETLLEASRRSRVKPKYLEVTDVNELY